MSEEKIYKEQKKVKYLLVNNKVNAIYSGFGHSLITASILISVGFVLCLTLKSSSKNNK
ncbi:MAG: hypothetical protein PHX70_07070 [Clostridium sp.]|nr:hypothetical protein [Clostridium sp.]